MNSYITKDKDRIDLICLDYYGRDDGDIIEQVWSVNSQIKPTTFFSAGVILKLPKIQKPSEDNITLW